MTGNSAMGLLVGGALLPHPPQLLLPEAPQRWRSLFKAYEETDALLESLGVGVVILLSNHWKTAGTWTVDSSHVHQGIFQGHGWPDMAYSLQMDHELSLALVGEGAAKKLNVRTDIRPDPLDYGTLITCRHLPHLEGIPLVQVSRAHSSRDWNPNCRIEAWIFGEAIAEAVRKSGKRAFIVAAGGLSGHMDQEKPYGVTPEGMKLDMAVVKSLKAGDTWKIRKLPDELLKTGRANGAFQHLDVLLGACGPTAFSHFLAYEGIQGSGHAAVQFTV